MNFEFLAATLRNSTKAKRKRIEESWLGGSLALPSCSKVNRGRANLLMSRTSRMGCVFLTPQNLWNGIIDGLNDATHPTVLN